MDRFIQQEGIDYNTLERNGVIKRLKLAVTDLEEVSRVSDLVYLVQFEVEGLCK